MEWFPNTLERLEGRPSLLVCWYNPKRPFSNVGIMSSTTGTVVESTLDSEPSGPVLRDVGSKTRRSRGNVSREQEGEGKQGEDGLLSETAK